MPICENCHNEWTWKETFKRSFTLDSKMRCPYCDKDQYITQKSKLKTFFFNMIVLVINLKNTFNGDEYMEKEIYKFSVKHEWIDYNGHMNDGEYAKVFSLAVDEWMKQIGLGADFRNNEQYTLFTLEMHLNYLKE